MKLRDRISAVKPKYTHMTVNLKFSGMFDSSVLDKDLSGHMHSAIKNSIENGELKINRVTRNGQGELTDISFEI